MEGMTALLPNNNSCIWHSSPAWTEVRGGASIYRKKKNKINIRCGIRLEYQSQRSTAFVNERRRVFLLDVYPLCYNGNQPRPSAFIEWIRMLFSRVTNKDPIIAVMDGERGNEYRRRLLPTYKANRNRFVPLTSASRWSSSKTKDVDLREALPFIEAFLWECNVPVVKIEDAEADDVVATLADQVLKRGLKTVIASPDKDFKQLISENVQLVMPMPEFGRWSFYSLKHYIAQYGSDPSADLSLRCMVGDESDCVPSLKQVAPGFGRKTAVKLLKKHGSLENLLNAAAVRTVGKPYAQDALTKYGDFLRRNLQVLSLRRDVAVNLEEGWCCARETRQDIVALSKLEGKLKELRQLQTKKVSGEALQR